MHLDPLLLSRIQWAWVIGWHILLPAFTVGLASYVAVLEGLFLFHRSGPLVPYFSFLDTHLLRLIRNGGRVRHHHAIPVRHELVPVSDAASNVISPMLAYEDLMAFFLEATFLGVLLFGRHLVPRWTHFLAACMVAVGTLFSSFWILSVNSWMQTPAGFEVRDGRFFPTSWMAAIFNPSFPYRLAHNVSAFYVTTAFVVLGVSAYLIRGPDPCRDGERTMRMASGSSRCSCRCRSCWVTCTASTRGNTSRPNWLRLRAATTRREGRL